MSECSVLSSNALVTHLANFAPKTPREEDTKAEESSFLIQKANSGGTSAPSLKPRASSSLLAPIRAGCKGDGALVVTSKCPLDRYGERERGNLQLFQRFSLGGTTVAVLLVQTQQLFPKAQPPQLLSLKKTPTTHLQNASF